jgi:hypothetical protein
MDESDLSVRETRNDVRFGEDCVEALVRDAVAVEYDAVPIPEIEAALRKCSSGQY